MSKALIKETLRSISRTKTRFISIIAIVALGISFFVGVNVTGQVMRDTADEYFDDTRLMDLSVVSNLGLTEEDIKAISQVNGVSDVMPSKYIDAVVKIDGNGLVDVDGSQFTIRTRSLNLDGLIAKQSGQEYSGYLNQPVLTDGRWPVATGECVLDKSALDKSDKFVIGGTFSLVGDESDILESLSTDTYTIVGFVESPYYISYQRGNSLTASGKVSAFIYIPESDMKSDYYTEVFIRADGAEEYKTYSDEYTEYIDTIEENIKAISERCLQARISELKPELEKQIADGEVALAEEEPKARAEIDKAKAELDDLRKLYLTGDQDLADAQAELNQKMAEAQDDLSAGESEHSDGLALWKEKKSEYDAGLKEWETQKARYDAGEVELNDAKQQLDSYAAQIATYDTVFKAAELAQKIFNSSEDGTLEANIDGYIAEAEAAGNTEMANALRIIKNASSEVAVKMAMQSLNVVLKNYLTNSEGKKEELDAAKQQFAEGEALYNEKKAEMEVYDQELTSSKATLDAAKIELDKAEAQLGEGELEIARGRATMESEGAKAQKEIDDKRVEFEEFKANFSETEKKYLNGINEAEEKLVNAKKKLEDAKTLLKNTDNPEWYITDRYGVPGYESYEDSAEQIETIAKVFPVFFFLVAILVCLTTMTRMVEEERTQLGTLKALGYSEKEIAGKYVLYAFLGSTIGAVLGFAIGFTAFPTAIFAAYRIMYTMPQTELRFDWMYAALGLVIASFLTIFAALIVCIKDLKIVPAQLMRPKSPKAGKRVLLEKIPFIWTHINFTSKVTIRNLLRNKRRFFMTILGVAGCSALLLTGFGLSDSVKAIVDKQYDEKNGISQYDVQILLTDHQELNASGNNMVLEEIKADERIEDAMLAHFKTVDIGKVDGYSSEGEPTCSKELSEISMVVPQTKERLSDFIILQNRVTREEYSLTGDGVLITEKSANAANLSEGDKIYLTVDDGETAIEMTVTGIVENYAMNYLYVSPELYEKCFGEDISFNYVLGSITDEVKQEASAAKKDEITRKGQLAEDLMKSNNIMAVIYTSQLVNTFNELVTSLNLVVAIFIVGAIALALVVLNNLTNVNISERIREIATIKVLGFYDKEVSAYIYRENVILSLLGMLLGTVGGIFMHKFVVSTFEVNGVMFGRSVEPLSFVLTIAITIIITIIVNLLTHFTLKKVSMVESMKSIE